MRIALPSLLLVFFLANIAFLALIFSLILAFLLRSSLKSTVFQYSGTWCLQALDMKNPSPSSSLARSFFRVSHSTNLSFTHASHQSHSAQSFTPSFSKQPAQERHPPQNFPCAFKQSLQTMPGTLVLGPHQQRTILPDSRRPSFRSHSRH